MHARPGGGLVDVAPAEGALADFVRNVYPLYLHDLSEWSAHYATNRAGRFEPYYVEDWLARETSRTYAFLRDGHPVGFAWVARQPFPVMSADVDYKLVECFVLRAHRRAGVASAAAPRVFDAQRGLWELTAENPPALAFWERTLAAYAPRGLERDETHGEVGFRFRND
jgi:predicted acetyltransferase